MEKGGDGGRGFGKELHLMFSTVSSGIGATHSEFEIIVGLPWLEKHDPTISWPEHEILK